MSLHTYWLSDMAKAQLVAAAEAIGQYDAVDDVEVFVAEAQIQAAYLPEDVRRQAQSFKRFGNDIGGLLLKDVPLGHVPATPTRADDAVGVRLQAARAQAVLVALLGDQIGYRPELRGNIAQDIIPVRGKEREQISTGSTVDLKTHVEMAFSPYRSDWVALLCLRADHEGVAGTTLSSIDRMLPLLDPRTIEILRSPRFRTKVDQSFLEGDALVEDIWTPNICVFEGPANRPRLRVDFAETEGQDDEAEAALARLNEAAAATQVVVRLEAGDLLITDNNLALHGRTPFQPRYDGNDRWLLRTFVTRNLRASESVRPGDGRIIEPEYTASLPEIRITDLRPKVSRQTFTRGY